MRFIRILPHERYQWIRALKILQGTCEGIGALMRSGMDRVAEVLVQPRLPDSAQLGGSRRFQAACYSGMMLG